MWVPLERDCPLVVEEWEKGDARTGMSALRGPGVHLAISGLATAVGDPAQPGQAATKNGKCQMPNGFINAEFDPIGVTRERAGREGRQPFRGRPSGFRAFESGR